MAQLIEGKRKAAGWVVVAILINFSAIGLGLAIYEGRVECWLAATLGIMACAITAWRLA